MRKRNIFAAASALAALVLMPLAEPTTAHADTDTTATATTTADQAPAPTEQSAEPAPEVTTTDPDTTANAATTDGVTMQPAPAGTERTAVAVTATVTGPPALGGDTPCEEDQPCWNPCTMGVNGLYPPSDPNHWVPGPCDLASQLPNGRRFVLEIGRVDSVADPRCVSGQRDWVPTRATVWVSEPDGTRAAHTTVAAVEVCAPLEGGVPNVSGATPELFRTAGRSA